MTKTMLSPTALALLALTFGAFAATDAAAREAGQGRPSFETLDLDGNGEVTAQEMTAHASARFGAADANGDGKIDLAEMQAHAATEAQSRAARMLDRLDTDGDGALSEAEMTARRDPARMIDRLDTDKSGGVSKAEFEAAKDRMRPGKGRAKAPQD